MVSTGRYQFILRGCNMVVGLSNGRRPVASWYRMAPNAKISLRGSQRTPTTCSGAIYTQLPTGERNSSASKSG